MRIVAIANRKGGVGKSTVSVHIATGLASKGHNVLLVDTDPQGHAGYSLGIAPQPGLFNLLVDKKDFQDVLRPVPASAFSVPDHPASGRLFVLPSDEKTGVIPLLEKNPFAFLSRLDELQKAFDYVIIDTAPTTTMFDGAVYMAARAFVYVTECEALSFDGLKRGLDQIREFEGRRADYNLPPNRILGIIPNKFRAKTENHERNLRYVQDAFSGLVWDAIPLRTVFSEATNFKQAVFAYAPTSYEAKVMWALVERFEKEILAWENAK
ncbi:MAG: ParA family protein [Phototrophicales bacterium]|nr:ParA family protein [Phototrophicales bacterium]